MPNGHRRSAPPDAALTLVTLGRAGLFIASPQPQSRQHDDPPLRSAERGSGGEVIEPALHAGGEGVGGEVLRPGKPLALLIYLALTPGHTASREHLVDLLWGDLPTEGGKHALRQTLWFLKQELGRNLFDAGHTELTLTRPIPADCRAFLGAIEQGDLDTAVRRYTGSFLPAFAIPGAVEFEHWADLERDRLRNAFVRAAETLARRHLAAGRYREAQQLARRIREAEPFNQGGWRLLLESLIVAGDHLSAGIEGDALEVLLRSEDRTPEPATRTLLRRARHTPNGHEGAAPAQGLVTDLIGREQEFALLLGGWEAARAGKPAQFLLTAPAGLGKSRLLADLQARLESGGHRIAMVRANPGERGIPYAYVAELVRVLADLPGAAGVATASAATLVDLNPSLSARYSGAPRPSGAVDLMLHRTTAVADLVRAIAAEAPLALLLDDMHWLDSASAQLLAAVLDRLGEQRILVVCSERPGAEFSPPGTARRIGLHPLSVAEVGALLGSLGNLPDAGWARDLPTSLHEATGGSPLLLLETLQLALERGDLARGEDGWASPSPGRLAELLQAGSALHRRIGQLAPRHRVILLQLAVAGAPLTRDDLAQVLQQPTETLDRDLHTLEHRGLALRRSGAWLPAHDEIAERVHREAGPAERHTAHARLGLVLANRAGTDPRAMQQAALHLAAGGDTGALAGLLTRWIRLHRRQGDSRRTGALAQTLLERPGTDPNLQQVLAAVPPWSRLILSSALRPALASGLILALLVGGVAALRPGHQPEEARLLLQLSPADSNVVEVSLRADEMDESGPLQAGPARNGGFPILQPNQSGFPISSPDGRTWAYSIPTDSVGVLDIFLQEQGKPPRQLTHSPGDDNVGSWSPDGTRLAVTTARWASLEDYNYDLAVVDARTGDYTRLTRSRGSEQSAYWAPDGTRIAFDRISFHGGPPQVCWILLDGSGERCLALGLHSRVQLLGWHDDRSVLLFLSDSAGIGVIARCDVQDGRLVELSRQVASAWVSPDGRWIASLEARPGHSQPALWVYPVGNPDRAREVTTPAPLSIGLKATWAVAPRHQYDIRRLRFIDPPGELAVGLDFALQAIPMSLQGSAPRYIPIRWASGDSTIATVDSAGLLRTLRPGTVLVRAHLAGLPEIAASAWIAVLPSTPAVVLREDWGTGWREHWLTGGTPAPDTARGPGGILGFWNRGDGSFSSGAVSTMAWDSRRGGGVEVRLSTPITRPIWQAALVTLAPADPATPQEAANRTRTWPPPSAHSNACAFAFPGDGHGPEQTRVTFTAGAVSESRLAPPELRTGRWYSLRLQLFPDGTCGVALDGQPQWRSASRVALDKPFRVALGYSSVDTRILQGPLEAWTGVKPDIDWSVLERRGSR